MTREHTTSRRHRTAMTLVELLISLSITSALLVALSAAFHASTKSIEFNDSYSRCMQSARTALDQILMEIRRADKVEIDPAAGRIQIVRPSNQLTPGEVWREYSYDAAANRITVQLFFEDNRAGSVDELAANVTACRFGPAETTAEAHGSRTPNCVSVSITCSINRTSVALDGAATPRRTRGL